MSKIERFARLNGLATPPAHGLAGLDEAGGPYPGGPVGTVVPARGRVAASLFALAAVGWAVPRPGVGDEGGASWVWAAAAGHVYILVVGVTSPCVDLALCAGYS